MVSRLWSPGGRGSRIDRSSLVHDQQKIFFGVEADGVGSLAGGDQKLAAVDGADDAAVVDVHGGDAVGGGVGDVEQARVGAEDAARRRVAQDHEIADFVRLGIDDLQAVGFGRDDVEFAAVGFEDHVAGLAGELKIRQQNIAPEIDDGETRLGAADNERERAVGKDGDIVGIVNDGDCCA